ncbi:MAG: asparagine synthase C-terminal domain-containing protein [Candidatus Diapherotrites archaeon]|nr:asparagine synthase C-terminal domain-containing protein [Candidatus Diapherotrites archaeon]
MTIKDYAEGVARLFTDAMKKCLDKEGVAVLFSGGVDSTLIATQCLALGVRTRLYTTAIVDEAVPEAEDLQAAKRAAKALGLPLKVAEVSLSGAEEYAKLIIRIIGEANTVKVGVAMAELPAMLLAKKDGCAVVFSGLGSEEIFAGYERHAQARDVNEACRQGLESMEERDLKRDRALAEHVGVVLRTPFLDPALVEYALSIPGDEKIRDGFKKYVLRVAAEQLGVPHCAAWRKKRAAQYGSRADKALERLARRAGFAKKSEYLESLAPKS